MLAAVAVVFDLSRILAGGIAMMLELVSTVLTVWTVGLVDCNELISEKIEDLTEDEQIENNGTKLASSWSVLLVLYVLLLAMLDRLISFSSLEIRSAVLPFG